MFGAEMKPITSIKVLSFGAGVQSSALLILALQGKVPRPDFAVFADTQSEPKEVYNWLNKMIAHSDIPIIIGTNGDLMNDEKRHAKGFTTVPLFTVGKGMGRRQCTGTFKIECVSKTILKELGYKPRAKIKHKVDVQIGISTDEAQRMKPSHFKYMTNVWPLIDLGLSRKDCIKIVEASGLGTPPRSACVMCPYKRNDEWLHLKTTAPKEFERAAKWDEKMRHLGGKEQYVHRSLTPLRSVDFAEKRNDEQTLLFGDECEGMCGT